MSDERRFLVTHGLAAVMLFGGGPRIHAAGVILMLLNFAYAIHRAEQGQ